MSPIRVSTNIPGMNNAGGGQASGGQVQSSKSFQSQLQAELSKQAGVKLSAHAQKRFAERSVEFDADKQARLGAGMDRIQAKGADKSLVLMDDLALVVSARNRVVITAVDSTNAKDSVFTGIDSAVIV
ncbi:MAG: TIGR02530 family flagellar biosynthesis protein [Armatimonadota bacterium]